ncbi:MAG: hypothetical protein HGB08_00455 [Candidatus Moranbacteria bacterium]|nr:hypothetical protein [Candidatus Moranbacteria bacterium]
MYYEPKKINYNKLVILVIVIVTLAMFLIIAVPLIGNKNNNKETDLTAPNDYEKDERQKNLSEQVDKIESIKSSMTDKNDKTLEQQMKEMDTIRNGK